MRWRDLREWRGEGKEREMARRGEGTENGDKRARGKGEGEVARRSQGDSKEIARKWEMAKRGEGKGRGR